MTRESAPPAGEVVSWERAWKTIQALEENICRVVRGKDGEVRLALTALFARGHLLIEDVPGTGKTLLARSLARSLDVTYKRVQCTPDLLPSDVTGVSIFDPKELTFRFCEGPVFTDILLADEVNRATPRTQSALLECMEERQVTADGVTHALSEVFFVLATANPIEQQGTFDLPEAQLDRFALHLRLGYPGTDALVEILEAQRLSHPLERLGPVASREALAQVQRAVRAVHVERAVARYIVELAEATRGRPEVLLGASPRAAIWLQRCAQVVALTTRRTYVVPDDVKAIAAAVLRHRLILEPRARLGGATAEAVVAEVLDEVPVPIGLGDG